MLLFYKIFTWGLKSKAPVTYLNLAKSSASQEGFSKHDELSLLKEGELLAFQGLAGLGIANVSADQGLSSEQAC